MSRVEQHLQAIAAGTTARKLENETLEFKQAKPVPKEAWVDLAEAAVCFANASGGTIVVGVVDDKSGADAFVGCDLDAATLRQRIYHLTQPGLVVSVSETEFLGKRLLAISVPEGIEVHATSKGFTSHRINGECVPMRPSDISRLSEERRGIDWSAGASGRPIDEIDPLALRYCRRLLSTSTIHSRQTYARFSDPDLLAALRAVADDGSLTRAAELMLCHSAGRDVRDAAVYQHCRTHAGEPDSILRLEPPIVLAFEDILQAIRTRQGITPVSLPDGQQLQIEDYPMAAIREALGNAFIHGDWRLNSPISIEHSGDYLRITSPGPLVSGITVHNILTKGSKARYASLAAAFRLLGLAEEVGQGIDRMYREMIRSGRDTPEISEDQDQVSVLFRGQPPNTRVTKFLASLPAEEQEDTDALLIVFMLCRRRTVDAKTVAPVIQRSEGEAQAVLRRLSSEPVSILEPTRATLRRAFPSYRLTGNSIAQLGHAVAYHRRATDDIDRKIVEHLRDYEDINSRTVQRLFDLNVYSARDILADLVKRQIIVRTSEQKRGVAVKYGRGPAFPSPKKAPSRKAGKRSDLPGSA
jgi:ATP-dependent DNA helicase RecG